MGMQTKVVQWMVLVLLLAVGIAVTVRVLQNRRQVIVRGAVMRDDADASKQVPITNVDIVAVSDDFVQQTHSDQTGSFVITLPKTFRTRKPVTLRLTHSDYHPLQMDAAAGDELVVARMVPLTTETQSPAPTLPPKVVVSNIRLRYVVRSTEVADVGSVVKSFQIVNAGNIPCENQAPCSPDGRWKAATGTLSLDAGEGNQFRNVRVACVAGPCPFTRIEHQTLSADGRQLNVLARNWSETTTFLVEADVIHSAENDIVRETYPAILGPSLRFSLPESAQGPSIEAELNGEVIVSPLGPNLSTSWMQCTAGKQNAQVTVYRCEMKPGYRLQ
jgi:hypothetical protein